MKTILTEKQGAAGNLHRYVLLKDGGERIVKVDSDAENSHRGSHAGFKQLLCSVFLPEGFPDSVSEDYLPYQLWDTIQAFASSLTGSLATKAVLEGVGVGDSSSTPLAATLSWLIKDGTGMVGRILFAWSKGTELDADSKKWRLFADILNDGAMCLELCAPFMAAFVGGSGSAVTGILCTAGAAKAIVGVAGGATRAALTQHQARRGNLADVSAKDGSQETLVNLAALITSLWLLPFVGDSQRLTWFFFAVFTCLHLFANYKAVKAVRMDTFNRTRFLLLFRQYALTKKILSVEETNQLEPVVMGFIPNDEAICGFEIHMGQSVQNIVKSATNIEETMSVYQSKRFALIPDEEGRRIHIILQNDCSSEEMLESYYYAALSAMVASNRVCWTDRNAAQKGVRLIIEDYLQSDAWPEFHSALMEKGWNTKHHLLAAGQWRASW